MHYVLKICVDQPLTVVIIVCLASSVCEPQVDLPAELTVNDRWVTWPGQFPYTVYVETRAKDSSCDIDGFDCPYCTSEKYEYCTGILLTLSWVATKSRCFDKSRFSPPDIVTSVIAGDGYDLLGQERYHRQVRSSKHHELLEQAANISNEIAILEVLEPFEMSSYVHPITIAKGPVPEGTKCFMVGYGQPNLEEDEFKKKKLGWNYGISKYGMCSLEENIFCVERFKSRRGPSWGDEGGPFVCGNCLLGGMYVGATLPDRKSLFEHPTYTYLMLAHHEDWLRKHIRDLPEFQEFPPDIATSRPVSKPPLETETTTPKPLGLTMPKQ